MTHEPPAQPASKPTARKLAPHTHTRTEGRAPVWGSEFTAKAATIQGGFSRNRCWAKQNFERLRDFLRASLSPLKQLSLIWNSHRKKCCRWPRGGPREGNVRHRPKHAATRLPPAGPARWRPTYRSCAAGAGRLEHVPSVVRPARKYGQLTSVQIKPLIFTLLRYTSAEQGRRRPAQIFCSAGTGGVTTFEDLRRRRGVTTAIDSTCRRYIAARIILPLHK